MTISDFSLKIILLFLPGIVSFLIIDNLAAHRQTKTIQLYIALIPEKIFMISPSSI